MSDKPALISPRTVQGTVEWLPRQQMAFQRFLATIQRVYESFGFVPIETPAFELKDVLLTKSGGENEKLVYLVQSSGGRQQGHEPDLALRFDLTVPLARYVAQHERDLSFPFRRYQIQRVYRGERPQRGREREFYQCDIDVIGKDELGLGHDAELPAIIYRIFSQLGIGRFQIQINNRKLLRGLLERVGVSEPERQTLVLHEVDRIDKIGLDKARERLLTGEAALPAPVADELLGLLGTGGGNGAVLGALGALAEPGAPPALIAGLAELRAVYEGVRALGVPEEAVRLNLSTVRGLDYYTGTVYETLLLDDLSLGSICSGGRYENLAGYYTKSKLPGVGISIGATRLFGQLLEKGILRADDVSASDVLVLQFDAALLPEYFRLASELRAAGLRVEVYVDAHKVGKQLKYADRAGTPYAVLMGSAEQEKGVVTLKHLRGGSQEEVPLAQITARLLALRAAG